MKVLVTGASGLIGANVTRALVAAGHQVRALTRSQSDLTSLQGVEHERVVGDVLDAASLLAAARGCRQVFHTAAVFAYQGVSAAELEHVAVEGSRTLLRAACRAGVERVVLTSSSVVCGSSRTTRARTESDELDDEADVPAYDFAKAAQECASFALGRELGLEVVSVCPTMTVGPHDTRLTPSNALIVRYLEDPLRLSYPGGCNVVSVHDVARAHVLCAERGTAFERYLVGADNLEWSLLYRHVSELAGVAPPTTPIGHTAAYLMAAGHELWGALVGKAPPANRVQARALGRFYWYDSSRIRALGLVPRSTRDALADAIGWLAASPLVSRAVRNTLSLSPEVWRARSLAQWQPSAPSRQTEEHADGSL
jgi:dihydroflavonol-4-reductase